MEITYKGYSIITKKDEKRYCATGINGVYKENSMGESEEDAVKHLKNKIDMAEAFVKNDVLMKNYIFNRPFIATLEGKKCYCQ
jgi:hypothetical protein